MEHIDVSAKADRSVVNAGLFPTLTWRSVRKNGNKRSKEDTAYLNLRKTAFSQKSDKFAVFFSLKTKLVISIVHCFVFAVFDRLLLYAFLNIYLQACYMVFLGLLFCDVCELPVMQLSVCFHILPPLVVEVIPVFQLPLSAAV